jgi:hypothetical protein
MANGNRGETTGRTADGRFAAGNAGRPPGSRHRATLAALTLLQGEAETLTRAAIDAALAGDGAALRLCLERILPPVRELPARVRLPPLRTACDVMLATRAVAEAAAGGALASDVATRLAGVLEAHRRAIETADLEVRLAALEAAR